MRIKFTWTEGIWLKESRSYSLGEALILIRELLRKGNKSIIEEE